MKLENGHHISIADATDEQYHKFCKKAEGQGFDKGEYGWRGWRDWLFVGVCNAKIFHSDTVFTDAYPNKLLTIEQALSEGEASMTKKEMIQAMLDGRSFEHIINKSVIYFNGEAFRVKLNDARDCPFDINNYLRTSMLSHYKPIRTWEDDVHEGKPVLCWVSNENKDEKVVAAPIDKINVNAFKYVDTEGDGWKYATPVKPSECRGGE